MLGLLVRLVWLLAWIVALPVRLLRRWGARTRRGTYLVVEVEGALREAPVVRAVWPPRRGPQVSLHELHRLADDVVRDPVVVGVAFVVKGLGGGLARASSFRAVLARLRAAGKRVVVHLPLGGGTREAFLAAGADRVLLGPRATLAMVGFLASSRYLRGALDRAGITPEVHAHGRFKTAAERIERSSMSEAQREQVGALLDSAHGALVAALAQGRGVDASRAVGLVDGAPYAGDEAVAAKAVDALAYEDELAREARGDGEKARLVRAEAWWGPRLAMRPAALRSGGVIGVISVHGAIVGDGGMPWQQMAVDERVIAATRLARANPRVRGVVLHVDSPGGSALASDRMHHELAALAAEKPLVACMGDVAASGGYYVAVAAHAIVAQPTTITGSIGVIGARVILEPLLGRLGVTTELVARGAHARLLDPLLPLDADDKAAIDREIARTYQGFLQVVAEGRKRSVDSVAQVAEGRVWSGKDALAQGLVDQLGGFEDALGVVRARLGRGAERLRVVPLRGPRRGFPVLDPPEKKAARALAASLDTLAAPLGLDPRGLAFGRERVLLWDPVAASFRS